MEFSGLEILRKREAIAIRSHLYEDKNTEYIDNEVHLDRKLTTNRTNIANSKKRSNIIQLGLQFYWPRQM